MKKFILFVAIAGVGFLLAGCVALSPSLLSVVFVNDYSGSMSTSAIADMETAVKTFIGYMQSNDNGEYIAFGMNIVKKTSGFVSPAILMGSVNGTGVNTAATILYDAIYLGLTDISGQPSGRVKALIALTDGADNYSSHTATDVINYAKNLNVPVFTIGLGLQQGGSVEQTMKNIADQTGGKYYYSPSSSDLLEIYRSLIRVVTGRIYLY